jgi:hypothetical protein
MCGMKLVVEDGRMNEKRVTHLYPEADKTVSKTVASIETAGRKK